MRLETVKFNYVLVGMMNMWCLGRSNRWSGAGLLSMGLSVLLMALPFAVVGSPLKSDEDVILFPQNAWWDNDNEVWRVPVHGWVYESESDSLWRRFTVAGLAAMLDIDEAVDDEGIFKARVWPFVVDNERNKELVVRYPGEEAVRLDRSGANGHFTGVLTVAEPAGDRTEHPLWLQFEIAMPTGDARSFRGEAQLLCPQGLSVISDLDDTIKLSNVLDKKALLANTFLREFVPVPGMAEIYQQWRTQGAAFHYVSGSPWQLYPPLAAFLTENGFPRGSFHLRSFRLKDSSFLNLFASAEVFKIPAIEEILKTYPSRKFVLVGDSGEKDPEVYGEMARRYPDQVVGIMIHDVTGESRESARMVRAFESVPEAIWALFHDAAELQGVSFGEVWIGADGAGSCGMPVRSRDKGPGGN